MVNKLKDGYKDLLKDNLYTKYNINEILLRQFESWGYSRIETTLLEESDLFLRKSGGELASMLLKLNGTDDDGIALRPEYTSSIIKKLVMDNYTGDYPTRLCYSGPVYRRSLENRSNNTETNQIGVELIGSEGMFGNLEILNLIIEGFTALKFNNVYVKLNSLRVLTSLLDTFSLSERTKLFVMSNIGTLKDSVDDQDLENLLAQAEREGLILNNRKLKRTDIGETAVRDLISQMVKSFSSDWIGRRTIADVENRYFDKFNGTENSDELSSALKFMSTFTKLSGSSSDILKKTEIFLKEHGKSIHLLDPIKETISTLNDTKLPIQVNAEWDMGFVQGLSYYSDLIFEFKSQANDSRILCSGGRYDGLTNALGGEDIPALGFAYFVENLIEIIQNNEEWNELTKSYIPNEIIIVQPLDRNAVNYCMEWAANLREANEVNVVVITNFFEDKERSVAYAKQLGATRLIFMNDKESETQQLKKV